MTFKFLTPDSIETLTNCFPLTVSQGLMRYIHGAMGELAESRNWELHGAVTPEDIAEYFKEILAELGTTECEETEMLTITLTRPSSQLIPFNTLMPPSWTVIENDGGFAYDAQTKDFTVLLNGWYLLQASAYWQSANAGARACGIQNASDQIWIALEQITQSGAGVMSHSISRTVYLESGTIVKMLVLNTTTNGVTMGAGSYITRFTGTFLGE